MSFGQNVDAARDAALRAVEAAAQAIEEREVPSPGRATIYAEKERQALACKALPLADVVPADFDLVRRDMIVDGYADLHAAADAIIAAANLMRAIAGPVEQWRRSRKVALMAATTVAEVRAVDVSAASLQAAIAAELT